MIKTRSELEKIIEELKNEINELNEIKIKYENEIERLRLGLKNALIATTTYEEMIIELEEKNKYLNEEIKIIKENKFQQQQNDSELLLSESLHTLNILRTKLRDEKELNESLTKEIEHLRKYVKVGENVDTFQIFADRLCEELVLIDEDIATLSKYIKPPEVDIYKLNKGRKMKVRSPFPATQVKSLKEHEEDENEIDEEYEDNQNHHNNDHSNYSNVNVNDDEDDYNHDYDETNESTVIIPLGGKSRPLAYIPRKNYITNTITSNSISESDEIQDENG